jgi:hypothetical protein
MALYSSPLSLSQTAKLFQVKPSDSQTPIELKNVSDFELHDFTGYFKLKRIKASCDKMFILGSSEFHDDVGYGSIKNIFRTAIANMLSIYRNKTLCK